MTMADHCGLFLAKMADKDPRLWVVDGDLADSDGAQHFAARHSNRFIMAGIAEQCMVSLAAGMAACGLRPWVFSFAAFLCYRAYDQVRVGLSQTSLPVVLVGSHSGGCGGRNGKTHQTLNDVALMASLPNMELWAPADPRDLHFAMTALLASGRPGYLRLPREPLPVLGGIPGLCRWIGPEAPVVVVGAGYSTHLALAVRNKLIERGVAAGVVHCARLAPLPRRQLAELLGKAAAVFVIEDHYRFGGLADLMRDAALPLSGLRFGWPASWTGGSGASADLLERQSLAPALVAEEIMRNLEQDASWMRASWMRR